MMSALERVFDALALPSATAVDRRVAKTVFNEQADLSAADKRLLDGGLDRLDWRATLRPASVGLAGYADEVRTYPQIVVMSARLRTEAAADRLTTVIHRAIAHPLLLLCEAGGSVVVSIGLKRHHEREEGRVVVERIAASTAITVPFTPVTETFLNSLNLAGIGGYDLWALHVGWAERIEAFAVAQVTGAFRLSTDEADAQTRRDRLAAYEAQIKTVAALRKRAQTEKQLNRRIDLAREVTQAEQLLADIVAALT
ncbi:DUF4391 domain-containing protein [Brevundimonas mediterranea]|uniref:DUF4391 domain-containing protein n=1 Tax=Brevundimonas mediterranea TaxID=74329 RepID=A0AB37E651_9CAUL|nr:DUF4391 domain-containing protein [Brevundimonas mediterranea]QIH72656.1 DUF4391 domain-containing protein [Brevundimonas mediterranea]